MAIPRTIHYCWFGDKELPESARKCIESWKKYCPDYEIRRWSEGDIDLSSNAYTREACQAGAWGFVPDYLRLWIIYHYGGIYLDTDVQMIRSFDPLLENYAFAGMETVEYVALGLGFGSEKGNPLIREHMDLYEKIHFLNPDGSRNRTPSPRYTTPLFEKHGFVPGKGGIQTIDCCVVYPPEYFCPKSFETGITRVTPSTYSIHQFDASWYSLEEQVRKEKRWTEAKKDYWLHLPNRAARKVLGDGLYEKVKGLLGRR